MGKEKRVKKEFLFGKRNFRLLLIALSFISFGFILMVGGGSKDPNVFNPEIFSFQRIRLAPTFVLLGFVISIFAILTPSKKSMSALESLILGIIQGLTEFLPVSSSGHLELAKAIFGYDYVQKPKFTNYT